MDKENTVKTVQVKKVCFGEGMPKICVSITGKTKEEIIEEGKALLTLPVDVCEWRGDWYEDVFSIEKLLQTGKELSTVLGEMPLLFTFRTKNEGGEKEIAAKDYEELNRQVIQSGWADLIDVEVFFESSMTERLVKTAHEKGVKVVGSNHDFEKTPSKEELICRLKQMQDQEVDLPKIAVMPHGKEDLLCLLEATEEMNRKYAKGPIITMSMAGDGVLSRLSGEIFGSSMTFGAAKKASAPGQVEVTLLKEILEKLHKVQSIS